jgi:hypothetical protein
MTAKKTRSPSPVKWLPRFPFLAAMMLGVTYLAYQFTLMVHMDIAKGKWKDKLPKRYLQDENTEQKKSM